MWCKYWGRHNLCRNLGIPGIMCLHYRARWGTGLSKQFHSIENAWHIENNLGKLCRHGSLKCMEGKRKDQQPGMCLQGKHTNYCHRPQNLRHMWGIFQVLLRRFGKDISRIGKLDYLRLLWELFPVRNCKFHLHFGRHSLRMSYRRRHLCRIGIQTHTSGRLNRYFRRIRVYIGRIHRQLFYYLSIIGILSIKSLYQLSRIDSIGQHLCIADRGRLPGSQYNHQCSHKWRLLVLILPQVIEDQGM